jgi:hypothetical protein
MVDAAWTILRSPGGLELAVPVGAVYLLLVAWWLVRLLQGYLEGAAGTADGGDVR